MKLVASHIKLEAKALDSKLHVREGLKKMWKFPLLCLWKKWFKMANNSFKCILNIPFETTTKKVWNGFDPPPPNGEISSKIDECMYNIRVYYIGLLCGQW